MMAGITRRRLIGTAASAAPLVALGGSLTGQSAHAATVLVHDGALESGRRFAARAEALGGLSQVLEGDRVRLIRALLAQRPARIFGLTRHADHLLFSDVAREAGYVELARVQHRCARGTVSRRAPIALEGLARAAGPCWPEAFAELALGAAAGAPPLSATPRTEPAFSWVLGPRT